MQGEVSRIDRLSFERRLWQNGFKYIAGVDEVGRGPLAGPVYACAIILPVGFFNPMVRDSKRVPPARRTALSVMLQNMAVAFGIGQASPAEIDELNIRQASLTAMRRAVGNLPVAPDFILVDGRDAPAFRTPSKTIIKGDDKSFTIAAASIVAKVIRDEVMCDLHRNYPGYALDCNKGYGTAEHIAALKLLGPTPMHRQSFIKGILFDTGAIE